MRTATILRRSLTGKNATGFEPLQPIGKNVGGNPFTSVLEFAVCAIAAHHQVANQQQRPAITEQIEGCADWAAGTVLRAEFSDHGWIVRMSLAFCKLIMLPMQLRLNEVPGSVLRACLHSANLKQSGGFLMSSLENSPRITPFLWFDANAEEAAGFYISVFKNSRKLQELRNTGDAPGPKGGILTISFELDGQKFTALNGGPAYKFTEAVSFVVRCDTQDEVDYYWSKLTAGGNEIQCGWLKDKFGLCWQIVPAKLPSLLRNSKAMQAMMKMKKLDIAELERAAKG